MPRLIRNTAILAKIETTYGTDAAPTGAANAILISNASFNISANNVNRDLIRGFLGASEQLVGTRFVELTFDVELSGSGTAGTAPAWGPLLRACAMAETVTAGQRVEYNPISTGFESLTIHYVIDGVRYAALGCRGTAEFKMSLSERPVMSYRFLGIDGGATAQSNPSQTLSAFKAPVVITDPNAGDINLGCTYSAGAFTGGTTYPSRGLSFSLGNDVKHIPLLGGESIGLTNREITGSMTLDLTAAQEVSARTDVNANTLSSLGFSFGTVAGNKVMIHAPAVQRINPKHEDMDGYAMMAFDLRFVPVSGNDELRVVVL